MNIIIYTNIRNLYLISNTKYFISGCTDGSIYIHDIDNKIIIDSAKVPSSINAIAVSPDGNSFAISSYSIDEFPNYKEKKLVSYDTSGYVFKFGIQQINSDVKNETKPDYENIIYPNPASDFLNINSANLIGKNISIYNILSNKLMTATAESTAISINIESLPEGVYFIKIGEQTKMFVKE